jgi:hypothetical protein
MFSKPIAEIGNTRILVAPVGAIGTVCTDNSQRKAFTKQEGLKYFTATRQLTVYSNDVMLVGGMPTAMILPVPVSAATRAKDPLGCGIIVHTMSASTSALFSALEKMACKVVGGARRPRGVLTPKPPLDVHKAGAYKYSVVPAVDDFVRVDNDVFGLKRTSELYELLQEHYATGFAFLACIIDASAKLRPIAYQHDMLPDGRIFVPTRHYHPRKPAVERGDPLRAPKVMPLAGTAAYTGSQRSTTITTGKRTRSEFKEVASSPGEGADLEEGEADWDHKIFSIGCSIDAGWMFSDHLLKAREVSSALRRDAITRLPFPLPDTAGMLLRLEIILGPRTNEDVILQLERR